MSNITPDQLGARIVADNTKAADALNAALADLARLAERSGPALAAVGAGLAVLNPDAGVTMENDDNKDYKRGLDIGSAFARSRYPTPSELRAAEKAGADPDRKDVYAYDFARKLVRARINGVPMERLPDEPSAEFRARVDRERARATAVEEAYRAILPDGFPDRFSAATDSPYYLERAKTTPMRVIVDGKPVDYVFEVCRSERWVRRTPANRLTTTETVSGEIRLDFSQASPLPPRLAAAPKGVPGQAASTSFYVSSPSWVALGGPAGIRAPSPPRAPEPKVPPIARPGKRKFADPGEDV